MNEQEQAKWKLVPVPATTEMVVAIESAIDRQLAASGMRPDDMQRQDGDAIYAAAMVAAPAAPHAAKQQDNDQWKRGYFCAVAIALRENGDSTIVRSIFKQGGDPALADPVDIELFRKHGLMA